MTQIENLEAMLSKGKDGALVRYGLGTAYAAMPDQAAKEQAKAHLTACVGFDPEYSAAYLKLAQVLQSLGDIAGADEIYSQGIAVATRQCFLPVIWGVRRKICGFGRWKHWKLTKSIC